MHKTRHKHVRWHRHPDGRLHKHVRWHRHLHDHKTHHRLPRKPPARPVTPPAPPLRNPDPLPNPKTQPDPKPSPNPQPPEVPASRSGPPPAEPTPAAPASRLTVYTGAFGLDQAERLLWRAGFGPAPGQGKQLAAKGLVGAVHSLTRPEGAPQLVGPEPTVEGASLVPADTWGHDHLWWLDRMVRTTQPLVERMALIWHDWFATSNDGVDSHRLMMNQSDLFRRHALGSFRQLLLDVTIDEAMLVWLNGAWNTKWSPDENYARELMELFTLGADRGAYTETDVRQMARALTGWRADWSEELRHHNFRFDVRRHDTGSKTIFGQTGNFGWQDACRLCSDHPLHPSFLVRKLWSYFVPTPPSTGTQADLQALYKRENHAIRPLVEAILMHPDFYLGGPMVKPPVVYCAGLLRALGKGITDPSWAWLCEQAGQQLFHPPNVSGWDDESWLNTSTLRARWLLVTESLGDRWIDPWPDAGSYSTTEDATTALGTALKFWDDPLLTRATWDLLLRFSSTCLPASMASWQQGPYRAMRQNALRQLIATSPDLQTC
jgi:hypothetical protein